MKFFKKQKKQTRQPRLNVGDEGYNFRRSRTLTGSTSQKIKITAENKSALKTPRLKAHELHELRRKVVRVLVVIVALAGFVAYLISTYVPHVPVLFAEQGAQRAPIDQYVKSMDEYLDKNPLQRFGFALSAKQATDHLMQKHPEIRAVTISKDWYGGGTEMQVAFRRPLLVWQAANQRFFVDDHGIAFTYDHFGKTVVSVTDQSGISPDVGSSVASRRFVYFLGQLVGAVNSGGRGQVVGVIIPPSTREIDLRLEGRGYIIKTHSDRDPLQQAQDVNKALQFVDDKGIVPQYIDVRVAGKAFYK